jgi:hypothetical protein
MAAKERKTGSFFVFLAFFCGNSGGVHEVQLYRLFVNSALSKRPEAKNPHQAVRVLV